MRTVYIECLQSKNTDIVAVVQEQRQSFSFNDQRFLHRQMVLLQYLSMEPEWCSEYIIALCQHQQVDLELILRLLSTLSLSVSNGFPDKFRKIHLEVIGKTQFLRHTGQEGVNAVLKLEQRGHIKYHAGLLQKVLSGTGVSLSENASPDGKSALVRSLHNKWKSYQANALDGLLAREFAAICLDSEGLPVRTRVGELVWVETKEQGSFSLGALAGWEKRAAVLGHGFLHMYDTLGNAMNEVDVTDSIDFAQCEPLSPDKNEEDDHIVLPRSDMESDMVVRARDRSYRQDFATSVKNVGSAKRRSHAQLPVVVLFIGGVCEAEIIEVREMSETFNRQFIIVTSSIVTGRDILDRAILEGCKAEDCEDEPNPCSSVDEPSGGSWFTGPTPAARHSVGVATQLDQH